jgi:ubiquitin carboxyl-terminal hydrolase 14
MVRFAWRRDINKKAKIMVQMLVSAIISSHSYYRKLQRKVKFPTEYDALDLVTPELKEQLLPVSRRLKEISRDRAERRKVRKRTKTAATTATTSTAPAPSSVDGDGDGDTAMADASTTAGADLEPEENYRQKEREELTKLVSPAIAADVGASASGLYELVGMAIRGLIMFLLLTFTLSAIVTHKGAAADAGHYIGFVKKSVFASDPLAAEDDEDWYKFDDDKVSVFAAEKLATLDGGGTAVPGSLGFL